MKSEIVKIGIEDGGVRIEYYKCTSSIIPLRTIMWSADKDPILAYNRYMERMKIIWVQDFLPAIIKNKNL